VLVVWLGMQRGGTPCRCSTSRTLRWSSIKGEIASGGEASAEAGGRLYAQRL